MPAHRQPGWLRSPGSTGIWPFAVNQDGCAPLYSTVGVFGAFFNKANLLIRQIKKRINLLIELNFMGDNLVGEVIVFGNAAGQVVFPIIPFPQT